MEKKQIDCKASLIDSREVAEMVEKTHKMLLRDIRRYTEQLNGSKIEPVEFWQESTYEDEKGESRPCYNITKKGCEFIAHKLTGTKGTVDLICTLFSNMIYYISNKCERGAIYGNGYKDKNVAC